MSGSDSAQFGVYIFAGSGWPRKRGMSSLCVACKRSERVAECTGCGELLYCSEECSINAWIDGHSAACGTLRVGHGFWDANLDTTTARNAHYRRVLYTTSTQQLVLMRLRPGEDVGTEVHPETTQFVRVVRGEGRAMMSRSITEMVPGSAVMVPPGTRHNVWASAKGPGLWFYTLYSPPEHPEDALQERKP